MLKVFIHYDNYAWVSFIKTEPPLPSTHSKSSAGVGWGPASATYQLCDLCQVT